MTEPTAPSNIPQARPDSRDFSTMISDTWGSSAVGMAAKTLVAPALNKIGDILTWPMQQIIGAEENAVAATRPKQPNNFGPK